MPRNPKQPKGDATASKKPRKAKSTAKRAEKPAGGRKAKSQAKPAPENAAAPERDDELEADEGIGGTYEHVEGELFGQRKNVGGRPSTYKTEYANIARVMCRGGASDDDLADAFQVSVPSIRNWRIRHEAFAEALKVGKGEFDEPIIRSLALRAKGYRQKTVKVFMPAGARAPVYAEYYEDIPADVGAAKLWLCNRRPDEWRERKELTGKDGAPLVPVLNILHTDGRTQAQAHDD